MDSRGSQALRGSPSESAGSEEVPALVCSPAGDAGAPAVLFEAGYISNADDEAMLRDPKQRGRIVAALARAIEADIAARSLR